MTATIKRNSRFALAALLVVIGTFWLSMEEYQKDRLVTLVVRSVVDMVDQDTTPKPIEASERE